MTIAAPALLAVGMRRRRLVDHGTRRLEREGEILPDGEHRRRGVGRGRLRSASTTGARLSGPGLYTISRLLVIGGDNGAAHAEHDPRTRDLPTRRELRRSRRHGAGEQYDVRLDDSPLGAAGSVTITSLTQTEIVGTFTFVANGILNAPSTSTKNVTTGTFDLPVVAVQAVGPIPDNAGSTISGTLAGQPFTMATIAVTTAPTRDLTGKVIGTTLIFGGSNDTQGMGAAIAEHHRRWDVRADQQITVIDDERQPHERVGHSALEFRHGRGGGQRDVHSLVGGAGQRNLQRDAPRR